MIQGPTHFIIIIVRVEAVGEVQKFKESSEFWRGWSISEEDFAKWAKSKFQSDEILAYLKETSQLVKKLGQVHTECKSLKNMKRARHGKGPQ